MSTNVYMCVLLLIHMLFTFGTRQRVAFMKKPILALSLFSMTLPLIAQNFPEDAAVGRCYALCYTPDLYTTVTDKILVKEATTKVELLPAKYKTVTEQILISPEAKIIEYIPATYTTVIENKMSTKPTLEIVQVPAIFDTIEEKILIKPEHTEYRLIEAKFSFVSDEIEVKPQGAKWVPIKDNTCKMADPDACTVWKKDIDPAEYRQYSRQIMESPASYEEVLVPDEYVVVKKAILKKSEETKEVMMIPNNNSKITKQVQVAQEQVIEKIIPAKYATITKEILLEPARVVETVVPAVYQEVTKKVLAQKGGMTEWKEVVCTDQIPPTVVKKIAQSLNKKGYNLVESTKVSSELKDALISFQENNGLAMGHFDTETLTALGITNF
jgi:hypothetical protein